MVNNYKEFQKIKNSNLIKQGFFNGDKGNGSLNGKNILMY